MVENGITLVEKEEESAPDDNLLPDSLDKVSIENSDNYLIYGVTASPPFHVTIMCALQQGLLSISANLIISLLVAEAVCAPNNEAIKAKLISSSLFMSGVTTLAMNLVGVGLPLFQGATGDYIVPLLLVANQDTMFCSNLIEQHTTTNTSSNGTLTADLDDDVSMQRILYNIRSLQGSLMIAGAVHTLLGMTGMVGVLLRFIGPLTIVPTLLLLFIYVTQPILKFVEVNWGIALSTVFVAVILFLYLSKHNMPVPVWTPSGGFRIVRYPLHQIFAILISILLNWLLCGILTATGVLTDDPKDIGFNARTDARSHVINENPWFSFPYPGQFGMVEISGAAIVACMIATLISVLDSIGDYYACARVCRVPAPPAHAVNRGILVEGLCSFMSGAVGCGHATTTNGGNVGAIGVTRVASRQVFVWVGVLYILFGIFGKFCAVFITMPYPVIGGATIVLLGTFFGVVISNLEVTKMSSPRNIAILGLSTSLGLMIPMWVQKTKAPFNTGNENFDKVLGMLFGNPNLTGLLIAFLLDNTVAGTKEERGIAAWEVPKAMETAKVDPALYNEGYEVYEPLIPKRILSWKITKYIPFLPYRPQGGKNHGNGVVV